ncbi:hypothetical protein MMC07_004071 [Pseudocyphellaria aurata]|nr:hypothetical protein [Pseudocyphellaria aurata]
MAGIYRAFFLFIEPVSALVGAYYACFEQTAYLQLTHASSAPEAITPISTRIILTQLSNLYAFFAINEALVLRSTTDLTVWRTVLVTLLLADIGHLCSVSPLGAQIYWNVFAWNAIDWGNVGFVYLGALMRLSFLLGVGVQYNIENRPGRKP